MRPLRAVEVAYQWKISGANGSFMEEYEAIVGAQLTFRFLATLKCLVKL